MTATRGARCVPPEQYVGEWVVSSMLLDRAEKFPDVVAVRAERDDITYADLADRAARFADGLRRLGVGPGDRVATMLPPVPEYLTAWFGIVWAGAIDVPINNDFFGEYLRHVLSESGAVAIVVDVRFVERVRTLQVPTLRHIIVVDDAVSLDLHRFADLAAGDPLGPIHREERDVAYVMYTSGTTGPSKGAILPHRTALWNAYAWIDILDLTARDVAYSMFPLFHVTARSAVVTSSLWAGASVVLRNGFSLSKFWDEVRSSGATFFAYMGSVIHLLHAEAPSELDSRNDVRVAFGAAAPPGIIDDFEKRFGLELLEVYGSTELGPASAPSPGKVKRGTMGRICPHLEIQIQDPDTGAAQPAGSPGEICARPATPMGLFAGYWSRPDATIDAFRDLWFHTGDRGYLDDEGYLVFVDRMKDCIRRRGENISSFEVERSVNAHPSVRESAAFAAASDIGEEEVMVAVVVESGKSVDPAEFRAFCDATMPRFAVPAFVRIVNELPKTPSQRIQKFKLRAEGITADTIDIRPVRAPRTSR
jgi:crotonobetaine/carnitine-CoA ligase